MATYTEGKRHGDVFKRELPEPLYCRETVTVASGNNLAVGTVVARITASGKYQQLAPGGTGGAQTAAGVLAWRDVDASAADATGVVTVRGHVVLSKSALIWPAGITDPQKATALSQLAALGLVARDTV